MPLIPDDITTSYNIIERATCPMVLQNYRSMLRDMFWGYLLYHPKHLATPQSSGTRRSQARTVRFLL